jgi:hypothetical protein
MNIQELLHGMAERVSASASVKNVYGDPVVVGDRTVIRYRPIANSSSSQRPSPSGAFNRPEPWPSIHQEAICPDGHFCKWA